MAPRLDRTAAPKGRGRPPGSSNKKKGSPPIGGTVSGPSPEAGQAPTTVGMTNVNTEVIRERMTAIEIAKNKLDSASGEYRAELKKAEQMTGIRPKTWTSMLTAKNGLEREKEHMKDLARLNTALGKPLGHQYDVFETWTPAAEETAAAARAARELEEKAAKVNMGTKEDDGEEAGSRAPKVGGVGVDAASGHRAPTTDELKAAYAQGREASNVGHSEAHCPYKAGSALKGRWVKGLHDRNDERVNELAAPGAELAPTGGDPEEQVQAGESGDPVDNTPQMDDKPPAPVLKGGISDEEKARLIAEGEKAHKAGKAKDSPYPIGTAARGMWNRGYDAAAKAAGSGKEPAPGDTEDVDFGR